MESNYHEVSNRSTLERLSLIAASLIGLAIAAFIVIAWFPKSPSMWNLPLQELDAPAHYYFIQKLQNDGFSKVFALQANDGFYPPLFHIVAVAVMNLCALFGVHIGIYAAVNITWLIGSAFVFPAGMLLLSWYFFRKIRTSYAAILCGLVPILSVASAAHPFLMLLAGPLLAYGFASSMVPFFIYFTLRLMDAINEDPRKTPKIILWSLVVWFAAIIIMLAHPRIGFTYLLIAIPFIVMKSSKRLLAWGAVILVILAAAFGAFMYFASPNLRTKLFDPIRWFHTFVPKQSIPESLGIVFTDCLPSIAGMTMFIAVVCALIFSVMKVTQSIRMWHIHRNDNKVSQEEKINIAGDSSANNNLIASSVSFIFVAIVYVCSTSINSVIAGIVTAPWYRGEARTLPMLPLVIVPLLVATVVAMIPERERFGYNRQAPQEQQTMQTEQQNQVKSTLPTITPTPGISYISIASFFARYSAIIMVTIIAFTTIVAQFDNDFRSYISHRVEQLTQLNDFQPNEQLTATKYKVLQDATKTAGPQGIIISDPLNGSMYAQTLFNAHMFYPVFNPMSTKNGKAFAQLEFAFASGSRNAILDTACTIGPSVSKHDISAPKYLLTMGPQAPSLNIVTDRSQFDMFHNQKLINDYVDRGILVKVSDYSRYAPYARDWALYKFTCE